MVSSIVKQVSDIVSIVIILFACYFLVRYHTTKKLGTTTKLVAWSVAIFFIIIGLISMLFAFHIFRSAGLNVILIVIGALMALFSFGFMLSGIMMILMALGKVKKIFPGTS